MPSGATLADAEALVAAYLRDDPDVAALVDERVWTRIPDGATFPLIRLARNGGLPATERPLWLDRARIQIEAWADTKADAYDLAATAQAALFEMAGSFDLGVVSGVESALGMQWVPDPETDRPRYLFAVQVFVHPPTS